MSKILLNATTNIIGGGVKNSALLVKMALLDNSFEWHFAISSQVADLLDDFGIDLDLPNIIVFKDSPARNRKSKKKLKFLESTIDPDIVYTMAGPAYVKFKKKHVMGISNGYITHATWEAFMVFGSWYKTLKFMSKVAVQSLESRRADNLIFQTETARNNFNKRMFFSKSQTIVISNAFDESIINSFVGDKFNEEKNDTILIICPGADYLHKGFQFIPKIAKQIKKLKEKCEEFKFILTLPDGKLWSLISKESKQLGVEENIVNYGPYSYNDVAKIYEGSHIVFIPSLLETFCASYLEAILMNKPLVVSNRSFAREVCGSYAIYIEPKDFNATALELLKVMRTKFMTPEKYQMRQEILMKFGSQKERFDQIKSYLESLINNR